MEWDVLEPSSATLFSDSEKSSMSSIPSSAIFRLTSEDGDQGFPGKLLVEVLVGLLNPGQTKFVTPKDEYPLGSIIFVYRAKLVTEGQKVVSPVNLTQVSMLSWHVPFVAEHGPYVPAALGLQSRG